MDALSRFTVAAALTAATTVAMSCAQAADIARFPGGYGAVAVNAGQIEIYDYEPGTYTRAYWAAPWAGRRYFPMTGKKPRYGRHENLKAPSDVQVPEDFYREWSTSRAFALPPPIPLTK